MSSQNINPRLMKAAVFGANDGIITTFAVVAGVSGAHLAVEIVLILGVANLVADGLSMGLGDFLGEKSEQKLRAKQKQKKLKTASWHSGMVTFLSFLIAGSLPLLPYVTKMFGWGILFDNQFVCSIVMTSFALFLVGALRTFLIDGKWWKNGLETLGVGSIAAIVAYLLGGLTEQIITNFN